MRILFLSESDKQIQVGHKITNHAIFTVHRIAKPGGAV